MTIAEILADLEARAKQATLPVHAATNENAWEEFQDACSPDRILALVAYVRKLERLEMAERGVKQAGPDYRANFQAYRLAVLERDAALDALAGHFDAGGKP